MATKHDLTKLDRRLAERLIRKGELTQEEWDAHLATLPDAEEKSEPISTELETGVIQGR
jgi:hypothetical protein